MEKIYIQHHIYEHNSNKWCHLAWTISASIIYDERIAKAFQGISASAGVLYFYATHIFIISIVPWTHIESHHTMSLCAHSPNFAKFKLL